MYASTPCGLASGSREVQHPSAPSAPKRNRCWVHIPTPCGLAPGSHKVQHPSAHSCTSAYPQLDRLCSELLAEQQRTLPFVEQLKALEPLLADRRQLFQDNPEDTTATLLREQRAFITAKPSSADGSDKSVPEGGHLSDDPLHKATMAKGFRSCELACAGLDLSTALGRRQALEFAFSSGSSLLVRLIIYGEKALSKRHPFLTSLMECRVALPEYYGYCLTIDKATGLTPKRVEIWTIAGKSNTDTALFSAWIKQHIVGFDYYHSEGGVYPLKTALDGTVFERIKTEDFWCRPLCVRAYCDWMHTMNLADGFPDTVTAGFTWKTWGDFYIAHLHRCTRLNNLDEQYSWLSDASEQFVSFQRYVQEHKKSLLTSPRLEENTFEAIAPDDVPPAKELRTAQDDQEEFLNHRDRWRWIGTARPSSIDPEKLPLLSAKKSTEKPPIKPPVKPPTRPPTKPPKRPGNKNKVPPGDDPSSQKKATLEPGSTANQAIWLKPLTHAKPSLYVSGRVWDVQAVAAHYKTTVAAKCWPTILNRRAVQNKLSNCPTYGKPGCTSITDARHVLANFDWDEAHLLFSRAPADAEKKKMPTDPRNQRFGRPSA